MKISYLLLVSALLSGTASNAQTAKNNSKASKKPFIAMFYNVENLYDSKNDPKTNDDEFTPDGKVPWTEERLATKIQQIGKVINDIVVPDMPDLIGLAEIENKEVLQMLTASTLLKKTKYGIAHYNSPDERGIDVALLYNPATFTVISSEPVRVELPENDRTRDILYVKGKTQMGAVIHVFVNHWPSRREGTELSEPKRMAAATALQAKLTGIRKLENSPYILIMGDFNDEPSDNSITKALKAQNPSTAVSSNELYSLLYPSFTKGEGSLFYKDWDLFDQIIVSGNLLINKKGLYTSTENAGIFNADYLLFKNKAGESRPNRTMSSEKYFGGYSDHLPVYVKFGIK